MARGRVFRIAKWIAIALLILPLVFWIGVSVALKMTQLAEEDMTTILPLVGGMMLSSAGCAVFGCEAELLEGMETVVFDAELLESTPVALDIDEWGRVLVAETLRQNRGAEDNRSHPYWLMDDLASRSVEDRGAYYQKWVDAGKFEDPDHFTSAPDRVVILEDTDADQVADARSELASWNESVSGLVAGIEAREGEIWVTSIPSVYRIDDQDRDGVAESIERLQTGFGVKTSLIGHDLHGLVWGPDGRLYFSMGDRGYHVTSQEGRVFEPLYGPGRGAVFRMNPDGSDLEVFATGVRNPQELAFDDHGNLFTGDNNGDGGDSARIVYLVEGGETGWAMPYQTLTGDYVRGPWVAEKLWELQHPTQPAWVLPPVAHIANGPAGFVHYPGLGLTDRYQNAFFLCDYAYTPGRSGIWSFGLTPSGAGMEMVDRHKFAWSVLATDFDFTWDGRMMATLFDQFGGGQQIVSWSHPASREDPRVAEIASIAQRKMSSQTTDRLIEILSFPDQRLRLRAQYELAAREEVAGLAALARDGSADLVPRLHALWGLTQIGAAGLTALFPDGATDLSWAADEPEEFRVQLAKSVGEAGLAGFAPALIDGLKDASARIQFFSAQSLGALGEDAAMPALFDLLEANADEDVFLRHGAVWALHRIGALEAGWERRDHASRSVRLAALLLMRHAADPRVAHFLRDGDPLLVVEAARAIYDLPIEGAMASLAAKADSLRPASEEDQQVGQALHRRVIGANVRLRSEEGAAALARYVRNEAQLESMRSLALEALGSYTEPPLRDLTAGFYRPLAPVSAEILAATFREHGRALVDSSLGSRSMEIANIIGELPLEDEELSELVLDSGNTASTRVSALRALAARAHAGPLETDAAALIAASTQADAAEVRIAGRALEWATDAKAALATSLAAASGAATLAERQDAWRRIGASEDGAAEAALEGALVSWAEGMLEPGVAIEVLEAAKTRTGAMAEQARAALLPGVDASATARVEARRWALAGGDVEAGRQIFQTSGDCQRCHGGESGHGGGAGPSLVGVGDRGAAYVLESMVAPDAEIAAGFGSVTVELVSGQRVSGLLLSEEADGALVLDVGGDEPRRLAAAEVASRTEATTGMPPMGLTLPARALRDVHAYVMSLE